MVRYYTVSGDLKNGFDFEYVDYHEKQARDKYDSIRIGGGITYKVLIATDDKNGDIIIAREG